MYNTWVMLGIFYKWELQARVWKVLSVWGGTMTVW